MKETRGLEKEKRSELEEASKGLKEIEGRIRIKDLEIKDLKRKIRNIQMRGANLAPDLNLEEAKQGHERNENRPKES